jgi:hypothetical protein
MCVPGFTLTEDMFFISLSLLKLRSQEATVTGNLKKIRNVFFFNIEVCHTHLTGELSSEDKLVRCH